MKSKLAYLIILIFLFTFYTSESYTQVESSKTDKATDKVEIKKSKKKQKKSKKKRTKNKKEQSFSDAKTLDGKQVQEIYEKLLSRSEEIVQESPMGEVNWSAQYVEARGETVIDTVRFKNKAQARAMAVRGAVVVAQRNLLEIINGVKVHGETTVENMITTNDYIYSRVDGIIKGAQMVGEPKEEWGMMVVTLKAPLYQQNGLASAVYDGIEPGKNDLKQGEAVVKVGEIDQEQAGLLENFVFKMGGKTIDPSLFPIVVDEDNNVLLDLYKIYDPKEGKFPKLLKTTRQVLEDLGIEKGVEIIDVVDSFDGKLVVSDEMKKKINWDKVLKTVTTIGKALLLLI